MMTRYYLAAVVTISALSCQSTPQPEIRSGESLSARELIKRSPVIVIGTTRSVKPVGNPRRVGEIVVQLNEIEATVERVLKGDLADNEKVRFWRYTLTGDYPLKGGSSPDFVNPGMRSVFFLDRDGTALRSTIDVVQSRLGLPPGNAQDRVLKSDMTVEEKIAHSLLPLTGANPEALARSLPNSVYYAVELIGKTGTTRLLRDVISRSVGVLGISACLELSARFPGQEYCLRDLLRQPSTDVEMKRRAERQLTTSLRRDAAIKKALQSDPENWLNSHARSQRRADVLDEISLLAMHGDPKIRQLACGLMAQKFPHHSVPDCTKRQVQ